MGKTTAEVLRQRAAEKEAEAERARARARGAETRQKILAGVCLLAEKERAEAAHDQLRLAWIEGMFDAHLRRNEDRVFMGLNPKEPRN